MEAETKINIPIVLADDDENIAFLVQTVFKKHALLNPIVFVRDGEALVEYLLRKGRYEHDKRPVPGLILLDLNMPRKNGREVLKEIRSFHHLREIPVIVFPYPRRKKIFTTCIGWEPDAYVRKPMGFKNLPR